MLHVCPKYGTRPVTVHVNDWRIVAISERKDLQPAHLNFAWDIQDIVLHSIDRNQLVLTNNLGNYPFQMKFHCVKYFMLPGDN